jgi:alpha-glucosidase
MLALYRKLIALRRREAALQEGSYEPLTAGLDVLAYARSHGARRLVVLLNFGTAPAPVLPQLLPDDAVLLASTHLDRHGPMNAASVLRPLEGLVFANGS